jgi:xanthine dehydrogenase large subunit
LLSDSLATYKIPGIYSVPARVDVQFLDKEGSEYAILKSKAVGEPPLMYGIGAYFSLCNAILAFNPGAAMTYHTPMTPERVLMALYTNSAE